MPPIGRLLQLRSHLHHAAKGPTRFWRPSSSASSADSVAPPSYVLLTNDDGPPDPDHSPFISGLPRALVGWVGDGKLGICVPAEQQSWRSKAHVPQETLRVETGGAAWAAGQRLALVTGTPAAAANFGVQEFARQHFGRETSSGLSLVVSGPNFGDNAGRAYMLSSGTLGAAIEAALSGHRAIALSFQRSSQVQNTPGLEHTEEEVATAIAVSMRLIKQLWSVWPPGVELYNINVPLGALDRYKKNNNVLFTLPANDSYGSVFHLEESQEGGDCWSFKSPARDPSLAEPGTDVWALHRGAISVTPMLAMHAVVSSDGTGSGLQLPGPFAI